ncbi:hydrogen peroxide-inducible genes activator [Betaproteobacteria bacterium]|nr:hydrogen peroxide-inducible genes activator [Betaproteobacteria bacterium]
MTLTELRYIIAVAQEKHFGRAAEACFVSQPTLSVSIKKLEDELNTKIFERKSNQIALTAVGERLVKQAQLIVEESNKMRLIADQGRDPLLGPLRLGVIFTIGPYLLPKIVRVIFDAVPNMPLVLNEDFTTAILEKLRNGSLDAGILAEPFDMHGLNCVALYDEDFVVAVPRDHKFSSRKYISSEDLANETMLLLGVGHCFRDQVLDVCPEAARYSVNAQGIQRTFEGSSLETIRYMVSSGLGITLLPRMALEALTKDETIKLLKFKNTPPFRRVVLVWRKSFARYEAIKKIKELIMTVDLTGCKKIT